MRNKLLKTFFLFSSFAFSLSATDFKNVSVHDPSIIRTPEGMYYIIGSHMAGAKTPDLIRWTQLGTSVSNQSYFRDIKNELSEALTWGQTETFWAGEYVRLANGKYYMYYCVCRGDCPQGAIGYAVADSPEGSFTNLGILRRSSGWNATIDPGNGSQIAFRAESMPNCVDPAVFFDKDGRLWMVYGSYSGGIFILELNPEDGSIKEGQTVWGTKLTGGDHVPLEGAYILYSPETDYYYLFISMGGLAADGGYNVRVARCKTPNGTYLDAKGQSMLGAKSNETTMYNYGLKLMGNHRFLLADGEKGTSDGYVSPGHNSAYYDSVTGKYYLIFHTRFPGRGEAHEVRVHQMFMNQDGWPVLAPHRYAGEYMGMYDEKEYIGTYKMINHGTGVSKTIIESQLIALNADHTISGAVTGTWTPDSEDSRKVSMKIGLKTYKGYFLVQGDPYTSSYKMTFTLSGYKTNESVWGSKVVSATLESTECDLEPDADYMLWNAQSGYYLDVADGGKEERVNIQQWDYRPDHAQTFRLHPVSEGFYQLQTACSDYQMAVCIEGGSTVAGKNATTCLSADTLTSSKKTLFKVVKVANDLYAIKSRTTSNALRVIGTANGDNVNQYTYNKNSDAFHWIFTKVKKGSFTSVVTVQGDQNKVKVWNRDRTVYVSSPEIVEISLYHVSGLLLDCYKADQIEFKVLQAGSYVVVTKDQYGNRTSSRVQLF